MIKKKGNLPLPTEPPLCVILKILSSEQIFYGQKKDVQGSQIQKNAKKT